MWIEGLTDWCFLTPSLWQQLHILHIGRQVNLNRSGLRQSQGGKTVHIDVKFGANSTKFQPTLEGGYNWAEIIEK